MKNFIKGCVFVATIFLAPMIIITDEPTGRTFFWFIFALGAGMLLMWRLDMLDLPKKYRYGKEEEQQR